MAESRALAAEMGKKLSVPPELILAAIQLLVQALAICQQGGEADDKTVRRLARTRPVLFQLRAMRAGVRAGLSAASADAFGHALHQQAVADKAGRTAAVCRELRSSQ